MTTRTSLSAATSVRPAALRSSGQPGAIGGEERSLRSGPFVPRGRRDDRRARADSRGPNPSERLPVFPMRNPGTQESRKTGATRANSKRAGKMPFVTQDEPARRGKANRRPEGRLYERQRAHLFPQIHSGRKRRERGELHLRGDAEARQRAEVSLRSVRRGGALAPLGTLRRRLRGA